MNLFDYRKNNFLDKNLNETDFFINENKYNGALSSWNLLEYIASLSDENVNIIFNSVSCVVELFSSLSELQQQIVSRLMIFGNEDGNFIGEKAMSLWITPSRQDELTAALKNLRFLKIIKFNISTLINQKSNTETITLQYQLNKEFHKTLSKYICDGMTDSSFEMLNSTPESKISYISLTNFVRKQWNNVLNIIVELSGHTNIKDSEVSDILNNYKIISADLLRIFDKINLISFKYRNDFSKNNINASKAIKLNLDFESAQNEIFGQLYDGFDEEDYSFSQQEQYFDIYNDLGSEIFDLKNDTSDDEYLPITAKIKKTKKYLLPSKSCPNNFVKKQMDKIFEQKLAPKAFRWLLCDLCNQILVLINGFIGIAEEELNRTKDIKLEKNCNQYKNTLNPKIADVISLIFRLSSSKVGQPIFISNEVKGNDLLIRFILLAYDLGLIYFNEELLKNCVYPCLNKGEIKRIPNIEVIYTTPYSILIGSDGFKLQSMYSVFKVTSDCSKTSEEKIEDLLLPSHFYYDEKTWMIEKDQKTQSKEPGDRKKHYAQIEAGIIVQSNFRIYCYTASPLQAKILRHLCQLKVRGPNVISGILTRKGLLSAYSMGVTAEQILRFFTSNAHPIILKRYMINNTNLIPVSVESQLKLWEKDKNRLIISSASIFSDWGTTPRDFQLYNQTVLYALNRNIVLYYVDIATFGEERSIKDELNSTGNLVLIIKGEYEEDIKTFIRAKRESLNY